MVCMHITHSIWYTYIAIQLHAQYHIYGIYICIVHVLTHTTSIHLESHACQLVWQASECTCSPRGQHAHYQVNQQR